MRPEEVHDCIDSLANRLVMLASSRGPRELHTEFELPWGGEICGIPVQLEVTARTSRVFLEDQCALRTLPMEIGPWMAPDLWQVGWRTPSGAYFFQPFNYPSSINAVAAFVVLMGLRIATLTARGAPLLLIELACQAIATHSLGAQESFLVGKCLREVRLANTICRIRGDGSAPTR